MKKIWRLIKDWMIAFAIKGLAEKNVNKARRLLLSKLNDAVSKKNSK